MDGLSQNGSSNGKATCVNKSGFTLIELIIVVAMIAILGSVTIPIYSKYTEKAEFATAQVNVRSMTRTIEENKMSFELDDLDGYSSVIPTGSGGKYELFDKAIFEQIGDPDKKSYSIAMVVSEGVQYIWIKYFPDPEDHSEYYWFENEILLKHAKE